MMQTKEFPANHVIIKEGCMGQEMYILLRGSVEVSVEGISIARISAKGSFLGEICALMGSKRIATVKTLEASKFYVISDLSAYFTQNPESGFLMAKTLAGRLIDMNKNFVELKKTLAELSAKSLASDSDGRRKVEQVLEKIDKNLLIEALPLTSSIS